MQHRRKPFIRTLELPMPVTAGPAAYFTRQGADTGEEEGIELIPYGCTSLRITGFPVR